MPDTLGPLLFSDICDGVPLYPAAQVGWFWQMIWFVVVWLQVRFPIVYPVRLVASDVNVFGVQIGAALVGEELT